MGESFVRSGQGLLVKEEAGRLKSGGYEREMFLVCHIDGLIEARSGRIDQTPYLVYAVGDRLSLADSARGGTLTEVAIKNVRETLSGLKERLPMYLLRPENLCLDPGLIYLDERGRAGFIYLPDRCETGRAESGGSIAEISDSDDTLVENSRIEALTLESFLADEEERLRGLFYGGRPEHGDVDDNICDERVEIDDRSDIGRGITDNTDFIRVEQAADQYYLSEHCRDSADQSGLRKDPDYVGASHNTAAQAEPPRAEKRRFPLLDTLLTTLFLVGIVLAVFAVLQSGILDHVFDVFM